MSSPTVARRRGRRSLTFTTKVRYFYIGFKTKAATFEVIYAVSLKDKIDPQILLRMGANLDCRLETFDCL